MPNHRGASRAGIALVVVALGGLTGCVERRYTIRTDPPGALVIVNGEEIGTTPVSRSFVFYGDRSVRIIKEGYQTKDVIATSPAPWYDNLVTEFFSENLYPGRIRDELEYNYKLEPAEPADPNGVFQRSEELKAELQAGPTPRRKGILGFFGF